MLHKVGLLPPDNWQQVPFTYNIYTETDAFGWEQSTDFKQTFCIEVQIEFIGVWSVRYALLHFEIHPTARLRRDTVNSVGLIPRHLPFTTSNNNVRTFRHAVSLDERRAKFKALTRSMSLYPKC